MVFPLETTIIHSCKCHVTYTVILFILFLFSRKWEHQTLNQYFNVFLMGSIKLLFLFLRPLPNHGTQRLPNDDDDEGR